MVQLHNGDAVMLFDQCGHAGQALDMVIRENAQLSRKTLAIGLHMGGGRHGGAKAALGPHFDPVEFHIGQRAILVALGIGQGRQHETVLHGGAAGKGHWLEQRWHFWVLSN